jgi:hypothetical protein
MRYNRRNIWAFAYETNDGNYDIRPVTASDKKTLIKDVAEALDMPWDEIRFIGGVALECVLVPKTKLEAPK